MTRSIFVLSLVGIVSLMGLARQATAETQPGDIPGLLMWLKADAGLEDSNGDPVAQGGAVATWRDQSGNGWDAVAPDPRSAPTLETSSTMGPRPTNQGAAVLRWGEGPDLAPDGSPNGVSGQGFDVPGASLADGQEATYVIAFDANLEIINRRFLNFDAPGLNIRNYSKGWSSGNTGLPGLGGSGTNKRTAGPFANPIGYTGSSPIHNAPVFTVLRQRLDNVEHFVNGLSDTLVPFYNYGDAGQDGDWPLSPVDNLQIGKRATISRYVGDMAEILIYGGAITDEQIAGLATYFGQRYGVPEPASLMLFALGCLPLAVRRRRRR